MFIISLYNKQAIKGEPVWNEMHKIEDPWRYKEHPLLGNYRIDGVLRCIDKKYPEILDIGFGTGYSSNILSGHGNVTAIDISSVAIEKAKKLYPGINFMIGDIEKLYNIKDKFDLITCIDVLEYHAKSPRREGIMEAMNSLLNNDGEIIFSAAIGEKYFEYNDFIGLIGKHFDVVKIFPVTNKMTMTISNRKFLPLWIKIKINNIAMKITRLFPQRLTLILVVYAMKRPNPVPCNL